jgi:hypothetical protein
VRRGDVVGINRGQPEQIGLAVFGIASAAAFGDFQKAECDGLANCRSYRVAVDAVFVEIFVGDRELAVVAAAVFGKFNRDAVEYAPAG